MPRLRPNLSVVGIWEADDPAYARPIAAPLQRCAELLGVDLATITRPPPTSNPMSDRRDQGLEPHAARAPPPPPRLRAGPRRLHRPPSDPGHRHL